MQTVYRWQVTRALLISSLAFCLAAGCTSDADDRASPGATTTTAQLASTPGPEPVHATSSTRSEAEFGGAFADPENLVAGPFVLVGRARLTTAEVLASFDGQKFPALLRAGHRVTVRVPDAVSGFISLGYGPLPQGNVEYADGHAAVTFTACGRGGPSSSSAGPGTTVTFWSGFVFATQPSCAPLDVYADAETAPHRLEIPLGAPC